jgi:hypothetical protein
LRHLICAVEQCKFLANGIPSDHELPCLHFHKAWVGAADALCQVSPGTEYTDYWSVINYAHAWSCASEVLADECPFSHPVVCHFTPDCQDTIDEVCRADAVGDLLRPINDLRACDQDAEHVVVYNETDKSYRRSDVLYYMDGRQVHQHPHLPSS